MPDDANRAQQPEQPKPATLDRWENFLGSINKRFSFFVSLPVVTTLGTLLAGHYQYVAAYQDKVKEVGEQQMKAAEATFTEVATSFATVITPQQIIYRNYRDAIKGNSNADEKGLEAKNARALSEIRRTAHQLARKY